MRSMRLPDAVYGGSPMDESFSTESSSKPQRGLFTLVFGCVILSILLTGTVVLAARLIPLS